MRRTHTTLTLVICVGLITLFHHNTTLRAEETENWPRFRGPNGSGIATATGLPVVWTAENILWRVELPGPGHSSPVVWGDYVFLTASSADGSRRLVLAYDSRTGQHRWTRSLPLPPGPKHRKNTHATASPATDGERVFVSFSSPGDLLLAAYTFDGELVWKRDLGPFVGQHGSGTSPVVYGDMVILANHQDGESFVVAFDAATGEVRWRLPRPSGEQMASYSTPVVLKRPGKPDLMVFLCRARGLYAVDPITGKEVWHTPPFPFRTVASPVLAGTIVIATSGSGGQGKYLAAYDGDASGALSEADALWTARRQIPYVPTPVVYNGLLFLWNDQGVVSCVDPATGRRFWIGRVGGADGRPTVYSSSPVVINGRIYCISERGDVAVVDATREFRLLGHTRLGEDVFATPAVARGRVYVRTVNSLLCIGGSQFAVAR